MHDAIELKKVSTNNLKAIDVAFPLGQISVVTGVSGSGKSSLVFDTLYAEAYRRYVESLSSFARQYLKSLPKPEVGSVRNLPPAIAVQQTRSGATNRSTVGTATELEGLLRILFTHLSDIHCTNCGSLVERDTPESIASKAHTELQGKKVLITAPLQRWGKVPAKQLKGQLEAQGFTRLLLEPSRWTALTSPRVLKLEEAKAADLKGAGIVIDRLTITDENLGRLQESALLAMRAGRGVLELIGESGLRHRYTSGLDCPQCGLEYLDPSPTLLNFNHPLGACAECQGFGYTGDLDWDKVIPDRQASLAKKGVAAWNFGQFAEYYSWAKASAKKHGIAFDKPFEDFNASDWEWLKKGEGPAFDGICGFFQYLESKRYKAHYRIHLARFRKYVLCPRCQGQRLNDKALACRLLGESIASLSTRRISQLAAWVDRLAAELQKSTTVAPKQGFMGVVEALDEARARLSYLNKIGVSYLSLARSARTLSGGELQRINMARCLGSALTDTLFCLDEPSAGLHARDSSNLLEIVRELRDQGNTVVLVEHERKLIEGADNLVEIGPKAGHEGGYITYAGKPTSKVAKGGGPAVRSRSLSGNTSFLKLEGACTHNLKNVTVRIPAGAMTAVCGVSGSGKTSLVQHTLYPLLARALGQTVDRAASGAEGTELAAAKIGPSSAIKRHADVLLVSQMALGRSSRSNIATYLGLMDEIRKLLADEPMAKKLGLTAGSFSFNTPGGRCETCKGLGTVVEDLSFLGEMEVRCPVCSGQRFGASVLAVQYRGKNLVEILSLTVAEARAFFFDRSHIVKACDLVVGLGMGYVTLGQSTSSFSGGEAQRLKLVSLMRGVASKPSVLIFDEPTTGLSDSDVSNLLMQLQELVEMGHTIIIVEHHLDVLRAVDWLIEVGPEAADRGGQIVYEGPPKGLAAAPHSATAPFLTQRF